MNRPRRGSADSRSPRLAIRSGRDTGSAAIWVLACGALLVTLAVVSTVRVVAIVARHRAESAADLAALAAAGMMGVDATGICPAARRIAAANNAAVRSCVTALAPSGRSGAVRVSVSLIVELPLVGAQTITASARAGRLAVPP